MAPKRCGSDGPILRQRDGAVAAGADQARWRVFGHRRISHESPGDRQSREFFFGALQPAALALNLRRGCVETEAAFALVPLKIDDAILVASYFEPHLLHLLMGRHLRM
ncbi:hypothetical protein IVB38_39830 [Bradyrhizobium sp. 38]|uniref:hypothetical protein n=1 Tax=unclassified Bradyrhizobium TaxID=2631580 RepID=UPI001FFBD5F7|nr:MULTISPECIES: hypothetical protein [unclassified Bradyrhizobium]MCK1341957.1 hypothetical protein [Bradyrhizobium sp. 38]MCK1781933.1 hypothetical protein [Bradyrhizobium sp. 132]